MGIFDKRSSTKEPRTTATVGISFHGSVVCRYPVVWDFTLSLEISKQLVARTHAVRAENASALRGDPEDELS